MLDPSVVPTALMLYPPVVPTTRPPVSPEMMSWAMEFVR